MKKLSTKEMEIQIIRQLVTDALQNGYAVAHHDGEEFTTFSQMGEDTKLEDEIERIMREIHSTDEETLVFKKNGRIVGSVDLVYGNDGFDAIANHTDFPEMEKLLAGANALADALEEQYA